MRRVHFGMFFLLLSAPSLAVAADWQPVAAALLKSEKTGFGGLCGIIVDHQTGDLWANLSDRGMFHSNDRGATWKRVSEAQPKGRTETPGCWLMDPTGNSSRMVTALVYGSPIAISDDRAASWRFLDGKSNHVDWCAVDWSDPEMKFVLTLKHESGGVLLASRDGGKSFVEVGKGYATGWIFDGQTAVVATAISRESPKAILMRTTDAGNTFAPCGDHSPVGRGSSQALPKWHAGKLYWLVDGGLIVTEDKGASWKKIGTVKDALYGPVFGKDANHFFVLAKAGVVESTDGGATWSKPVAIPQGMKGVGGLTWLDFDPQHDILYLMRMGTDLYRLSRGK
jgi:photosystem II stability/assembly factor-like uncharacterized protein